MSSLIDKLNKVASTKEALRVAINTLNESEVLNTSAEFDTYPDFIIPLEPEFKTYTVRIDTTNSNPESACVYQDDAVGMTPGYTGWQNEPMIQSIKPCVLNNGSVVYYLNKDNYTQQENGGAADLTGSAGDVMVEIPKIGYRLWNDGAYQYVSVTNDPAKADYCYYAHSLDTDNDCSHIYIGAYLGYQSNNNLYSRSSVSPTADTTLSEFRTYSSNRGTGYSIVSFFPWTLLQCLYTVIYKNLDSQTALGKGYISANAKANTGATNNNTFCYGNPNDGTVHMKFLGIEDMWGNLGHWLDGVYSDSSRNILTDYRNSQMIGSGHDFQFSTPTGATSNYSGYINKIMGTNTSGFVKDYNNNIDGTSSTYFADYGDVSSGGFAGFAGGSWIDGSLAGAFRLSLLYSASYAYSDLGARLMYKKVG